MMTLNDNSELEAAAERIALRQPDRDHRQAERRHVPVQNAHAGLAVGDQRLAVARVDLGQEVMQVAAETKYAGRPRTEQQIADVIRPVGEHRRDAALPGVEILQEVGIVARPAARPHEGPERARLRVPIDLELFQLEQAPRFGALHQVQQLRIVKWSGRLFRDKRQWPRHRPAGDRSVRQRNTLHFWDTAFTVPLP